MNAIASQPPKRKTLTIRTAAEPTETPTRRLPREQAKYVVWREGGDMPTRIYTEPVVPVFHAKRLSKLFPGERFHVLRSWRVMVSPDE